MLSTASHRAHDAQINLRVRVRPVSAITAAAAAAAAEVLLLVLVVVVDVAGVVYRFAYPSLSAHRVRVTGSWKLYRFPGSDCPQCLSKSTGCCFRAQ